MTETRLLLVSADLRLEQTVRACLDLAEMAPRLDMCRSASMLPAIFQDTAPDLLLVAESGLPHHSAERIAAEFQEAMGGPVLFLGDAPMEHGRPHLLRKSGPQSLAFSELHRLPLAIEHALRAEAEKKEMRLQEEILCAADAVGRNQKLLTIGRLAGSIAHEINNPLESVTNLLYLTTHEPGLPEQARTYLEMAQSELSRVVEISKQTLTFSRETAAPVSVRVESLLEEVLSLYQRRVSEKHILIQRQYDSPPPIRVFPGEVRQVFSNLISNAIEAMDREGRLRLRVRQTTLPSDGRTPALRISIADTGAGIPLEVRQRLGEPFFTTKGQRGTGLGLWVTRSIIRRHGGSLSLRSRTGERHGTIFAVYLPLHFDPEQQGTDKTGPLEVQTKEKPPLDISRRWQGASSPRSDRASGY